MRTKIADYIKIWETKCYHDGIPDEAPIELENNNLVPSYRRICKAILNNDVQLQSLGYSRPVCKIYMELKKEELIQRGVIKREPGQLHFNFIEVNHGERI